MKLKRLHLIVGCLCSSWAASGAHAQVTTLDYQGSLMTGTTQTVNYATNTYTSSPFADSFTAQLVVYGSLSAGNEDLVSYQVSLAKNGLIFSGGFSQPGTIFYFTTPGYIELTTANGMFTGAQISINTGDGPDGNESVSILPSGDNVFLSSGGQGLFASVTGASNETAGVWTVSTSPVPLPAPIWLMFSGIAGMAAFARFRRTA